MVGIGAGSHDASAFHSGGVGECDGCHTMHNSQGGEPGPQVGQFLLKGSDAGSTCLACHQVSGDIGPTTYHISTPDGEIPYGAAPKQLSPGGDFAWLKKTYTWYNDLSSPLQSSTGERHGHNIVAQDYGYQSDFTNATAPGGTYPSNSLSCISCHDPHGSYRRNSDGTIARSGRPIRDSGSYATSPDPDGQTSVGSYRLLGGAGYAPRGIAGGLAFAYAPPAAVAPTDYNRSETSTYTRVAYGSGMSDWCRNCHTTSIHNGTYGFAHPADGSASGSSSGALGSEIINYYDSYIKSGDLTGSAATSFLSLVPFEAGTSNYNTLKGIVNNTPSKGPDPADGTPVVMCLTCHRAHASGWDRATRWNESSTQITYNGNYSQQSMTYQPYGQGRTEAEALQAYYQIPPSRFAPNQELLCHKCHAAIPQ